jgi:hypothetical protein
MILQKVQVSRYVFYKFFLQLKLIKIKYTYVKTKRCPSCIKYRYLYNVVEIDIDTVAKPTI